MGTVTVIIWTPEPGGQAMRETVVEVEEKPGMDACHIVDLAIARLGRGERAGGRPGAQHRASKAVPGASQTGS